MNEDLVGKIFPAYNGKQYVILNVISIKNVKCVYAMEVLENDAEGEKDFFQISGDENITLLEVKSKKMRSELEKSLIASSSVKKPRKIKEDESISDYLAFLDDYYKTKVVNIID